MNYYLQQIVIRRRPGASITTTTRRRRQNHRWFPSYSSSSTILPSRHSHLNQQGLVYDSSSYNNSINTVLCRHLSVATTGVSFQQRLWKTAASWLDPKQQQQQQQLLLQKTFHRKWHSTMPQEEEEDVMMDYFAIFDMPRRYDLDLKELKQRYLRLMTIYHPDKQQQHQQCQVEESSSSSLSSLTAHDITNAYQILTEPHTRANHLLDLIGHPIMEDNNSRSVKGETSSSSSALVGMDFLLQVMEWRERIETLAMCSRHNIPDGIPCSCGSLDKNMELHQIWDETQDQQHHCEEELAERWNKIQSNHENIMTTDNQELQQIRTLTAQLQYWHRLETALHDEMEL